MIFEINIIDKIKKYFFFRTPLIQINVQPILTNLKVLDIGGGGAGVIGRMMPNNNLYIVDRSESELRDAEEKGAKGNLVVGDARKLKYPSNYFDAITIFFSLMYIRGFKNKRAVIKESYRVLKKGGKMYIWGAIIPYPSLIYWINLIIHSKKNKIETGYIVSGINNIQTYDLIKKIIEDVGFEIKTVLVYPYWFFFELEKNI